MAVALAPEAAVSTKDVAVQLVDVTKVFGSGEQAVVAVDGLNLEINGGELGLAERCAAVAPALWLFPVAFGARRAFRPGESVAPDGVAHLAADASGDAGCDRSYESRRAAAT